MLTDREAEHIPGCNMAFYKDALEGIGGFDPIFTKAGDDVDVCWRLQQAGCKIGFSPAAFVYVVLMLKYAEPPRLRRKMPMSE